MNLAHTLLEQTRARPNAAAIIDTYRGSTRITTFAELDLAACRVARLLTDYGLRPGDAVLVFHPMSAELYVALLALFRLRLVAMFLDPSAGREHIERCCTMHPPRALIAGTKAHLLRLIVPALRRIPVKFVIGWPLPFTVRLSAADRLEPLTEVRDCDAETPALLTFTSGSTGQPKGTVRSHGLLAAQYRALAASLNLTAGDVDLATLPIVALANLGSGVTSLIPDADLRYPGAVAPAPIFAQIHTHQATTSVASPAFFECLVRHGTENGMTIPSFKKLFTGGAPVFPRLLDQMQTLAPNAEVVALYGSTEAEPIAHVSRREVGADDLKAMLAGQGLLAGAPVEQIRLRILRDQWGTPVGPFDSGTFAANCCGVNVPGEIVVSGGHVIPGYLRGEGDEETKFRVDGTIWHRTGDAGFLDDRGRLWLLGRCVARIRDARGDLYPFAAETAVYQNPNVRRAALVAQNGRRILAIEFYEGRRPHDLDALRAALAWAQLDEIRPCPHIPVDKRHNAKIDYPALNRLLDKGT
ncbi:MAG: AMP-binding protein [Planctomycetes bacterium]|nr:AMP-binding protein [Planctomycetota bacterium]